ncbi:unnamed protein product [Rhizoctonia solani]|uniref:BTB domain-containing protein n=1 Tax=Rhizoctonia solani TaxID=456999 RepID=A0A8H3GX68_9AGAM|nr:unnamed protein product [Rhizoctonia solani]
MPPKRSSNANGSSKRTGATGSRKRVKKEEVDDTSNDTVPNPGNAQKNRTPATRDTVYYFEDGSVTLRLRDIVFKVHTSLLKAHSEEFCNKFNLCPDPDASLASEGTCDEDAIIIPDVQPSQFRNLMKIIYCLPSNSIALTRTAPNDTIAISSSFDSYLDIAILSRKFGMDDLEQWAKQHLLDFVHNSRKDLAKGFAAYRHDTSSLRQDDLQIFSKKDGISPAPAYYIFRFVEAIWYAKETSDEPLLHGTLGTIQHCLSSVKDVKFIISFLRIQDLREVAPSLFGFLFLLLLRLGNSVWTGEELTQEDRMAAFSAQSFLTPLPQSIKESIPTPIFKRPCASDFMEVLNAPEDEKCRGEISSYWGKVFPASYCRDINSEQFSVSIDALIALVLRRIDLGAQLRPMKCQSCRLKLLAQLDRDIQEVYTRLATYYKAYV